MSRDYPTRWVYLRTGPDPDTRSGHRDLAPSIMVEVIEDLTSYRVRLPDGTEKVITQTDIVRGSRTPEAVCVSEDGVETHPSFGLVSVSHASGNGRIFGSRVDQHGSVRLRIARASMNTRDNGEVSYSAEGRIIEIELSPARYAELLGAPNRDPGVPCSIRWHAQQAGPGMIAPPLDPPETDLSRLVSKVKTLGAETASRAAESYAEIERLTDGLPAKRRLEILRAAQAAQRVFTDAAPFLVENVVEALETATSDAKTEVEAFVAQTLTNIGRDVVREDPSRMTHPKQIANRDSE